MIGRLNKAIGERTGYRLAKIDPTPSGVLPKRLVAKELRKFLHFSDLFDRVKSVEGDVVECGVGGGGSLFMLSILAESERPKSKIHAFDSFEGLPAPTSQDLSTGRKISAGKIAVGLEVVTKYLENSGIEPRFIGDRIVFERGFFKDSLPRYHGGPVAFLHLDVDLYDSYKETLAYFYPRLAPGAVVAFDEYQDVQKWPGARRAIDEFLQGREQPQVSRFLPRFFILKK